MIRSSTTKRGLLHRGQAMVEFAMIAVVAILVLFLGIQFALLGQAALAVSQLAYQGARYASINPTLSDAAVVTWMRGMASPTIANNNSSVLNITITSNASPRTFQQPVKVAVTLDPVAQKLILLPNPFFGISFGSKISSTQSAMVD
ncbi:MAG TPA: TadE/TadG family type IV pilus assembly protein [Candidatus Binataceae bacterium]|nr:TadE/TadG family type IV pilus assembly protein [Candidatus Binataceae bacterium]